MSLTDNNRIPCESIEILFLKELFTWHIFHRKYKDMRQIRHMAKPCGFLGRAYA